MTIRRFMRTSITKHQARQIAKALAEPDEYGVDHDVARSLIDSLMTRGRRAAKRTHRSIERRKQYNRNAGTQA